jgi:hypothetical protein
MRIAGRSISIDLDLGDAYLRWIWNKSLSLLTFTYYEKFGTQVCWWWWWWMLMCVCVCDVPWGLHLSVHNCQQLLINALYQTRRIFLNYCVSWGRVLCRS